MISGAGELTGHRPYPKDSVSLWQKCQGFPAVPRPLCSALHRANGQVLESTMGNIFRNLGTRGASLRPRIGRRGRVVMLLWMRMLLSMVVVLVPGGFPLLLAYVTGRVLYARWQQAHAQA